MLALLTSLAINSFASYAKRARAADAMEQLDLYHMRMEKAFLDNGNYGVGSCAVTVPTTVVQFSYTCTMAADAQSYTATATGLLGMNGFVFQIETPTASGPVSVVGLRFRGRNFSTLPITNLSGNAGPLPSIAPGVGGEGAILLPQFAAGGGWATELVLANTTASAMTVRVDLFKSDGTPLSAALNGKTASSFTNLNIPAGGVLILAPRDQDGDDDF